MPDRSAKVPRSGQARRAAWCLGNQRTSVRVPRQFVGDLDNTEPPSNPTVGIIDGTSKAGSTSAPPASTRAPRLRRRRALTLPTVAVSGAPAPPEEGVTPAAPQVRRASGVLLPAAAVPRSTATNSWAGGQGPAGRWWCR